MIIPVKVNASIDNGTSASFARVWLSESLNRQFDWVMRHAACVLNAGFLHFPWRKSFPGANFRIGKTIYRTRFCSINGRKKVFDSIRTCGFLIFGFFQFHQRLIRVRMWHLLILLWHFSIFLCLTQFSMNKWQFEPI